MIFLFFFRQNKVQMKILTFCWRDVNWFFGQLRKILKNDIILKASITFEIETLFYPCSKTWDFTKKKMVFWSLVNSMAAKCQIFISSLTSYAFALWENYANLVVFVLKRKDMDFWCKFSYFILQLNLAKQEIMTHWLWFWGFLKVIS